MPLSPRALVAFWRDLARRADMGGVNDTVAGAYHICAAGLEASLNQPEAGKPCVPCHHCGRPVVELGDNDHAPEPAIPEVASWWMLFSPQDPRAESDMDNDANTLRNPARAPKEEPEYGRRLRDTLLDELAQKAAWCLENGATNENADVCRDVLRYREAMQRGTPHYDPIERERLGGDPCL